MDREEGSPGFKRFLADRGVLPPDHNPPRHGRDRERGRDQRQQRHRTNSMEVDASSTTPSTPNASSSRHNGGHGNSSQGDAAHSYEQQQPSPRHRTNQLPDSGSTLSSSPRAPQQREKLYGNDPVEVQGSSASASADGNGSKNKRGRRKKETVFQCEYCKQLFGRRHHKERHVDNMHLQNKGPTCEVCGACFHQKPNLVRHMKLKHQQRFYTCVECGLRFSRKDLLKQHQRETHMDSGHPGSSSR